MVFKKNIKIFIIGLSFAILPATINAMEMKPKEIVEYKNSRKVKKYLKKIKKKTQTKDKNVEIKPNENIKHKLEETKKLPKTIKKINNQITKSNIKTRSNKTPDDLFFIEDKKLLEEIEQKIIDIETKDSEYKTTENIRFDIGFLKRDKENLKKIQEKTNNEEIKNKIKNLFERASNLIVMLCEENINTLEEKILTKKETHLINIYFDSLGEYRKTLLKIKEENSNPNLTNEIDKLISKINNSFLFIFKEYTPRIVEEVEEFLKTKDKDWNDAKFEYNFFILTRLDKEITNFKEENSNNKNYEILDIANNINNLLINLHEEYISTLKNTELEPIHEIIVDATKNLLNESKENLEYLKNKKENLKSENKLNELINYIPELIIKVKNAKSND